MINCMLIGVVLALVGLGANCAAADQCRAAEETTTWADAHPELFEIYGHPFTAQGREHRQRSFIDWPAEEYQTDLVSSQPTVVLGANGELVAHGYNGWVLGSGDGGRTWRSLGCAPMVRQAPAGKNLLSSSLDGCGITEKGSILVQCALQYNSGQPYDGFADPTYHCDLYVIRSTDEGKTWGEPVRLNEAPIENSGANRTRFFQLPDGKIGLSMGAWTQSTTGKPLPADKRYERTALWISPDDGQTWQKEPEPICLHGVEPDLLVLRSGRILAAVRYQRSKRPSDPASLACPHIMRNDSPPYDKSKVLGGAFVLRNTAILHSDDNGKTWSKPRLLTGFDEQTGCLVQLFDGTVILVFGHKTDGTGQRFVLSYDQGETWSRNVYSLSKNGLYAGSVVLEDGTIVTVTHRIKEQVARFCALRWRPPLRQEVSRGGFWRPRVVEPLAAVNSPPTTQKEQ